MKKLIFLQILIIISLTFNGCALVSPFKPINSCNSAKNNGANCATLESNLDYSISKDTPAMQPMEISDNASLNPKDASKDEIVRLIKELNPVESDKPILVQASVYRVLIMPYSNGDKFYSARYVYITAGLPKWVSGNKVTSTKGAFNIDTPEISTPNLNDAQKISSIDMSRKTPKVEEIEKYTVTAYMLNCRENPSEESNVVAVFESGELIEVTDRIGVWLNTNYYGTDCYVHSSYLTKNGKL